MKKLFLLLVSLFMLTSIAAAESSTEKSAVIVMTSSYIKKYPELMTLLTDEINKKFPESTYKVFIDDNDRKNLHSSMIEFLEGVKEDNLQNRYTNIIKKERLIQYGKDTQASSVTLVTPTLAEYKGSVWGSGDKVAFKIEVKALDVSSGTYVFSSTVRNDKKQGKSEAFLEVLKMLQTDIALPIQ